MKEDVWTTSKYSRGSMSRHTGRTHHNSAAPLPTDQHGQPQGAAPTGAGASALGAAGVSPRLLRMQVGRLLWRAVWWLCTKLSVLQPCDPAVVLRGVCPEKPRVYVHTENPRLRGYSGSVCNRRTPEANRTPFCGWWVTNRVHPARGMSLSMEKTRAVGHKRRQGA